MNLLPSSTPPDAPSTYQVLGVTVQAETIVSLRAWIISTVSASRVAFLANHNLHSIYMFHRHPVMRQFYQQSDRIVIDGMPIIGYAQLLEHHLTKANRIAWLDHLTDILKIAEIHHWPVAHLGCAPGIGETAAEALRKTHPRLTLNVHHGHFPTTVEGNAEVLAWLHNTQARIILVGMGMPRQEEWLAQHKDELPPALYITCGATFDYLANKIPTTPRWMGQCGIEWLFRLKSEPRRLAYRYLVEPFFLMPHLVRDILNRMR